MLGGVTAHALIRLQGTRAAVAAQQVLYQLAWRIQLAMVLLGSALVLLTGVVLWIGERLTFFTGWLLLGLLLYVAVMAIDGAYLSPNLRRLRSGALKGESPAPADTGATTIQIINWVLLVVVLFLMTTRPF